MVSRTLREYRAGEHLSLSVILREGPRCIGRVGLRDLDWTYHKVGSLSYWIDPRAWGQGYATEASWFLCHEAFQHLGMRRIASSALEPNVASLAVLRRLGFIEEGRERESVTIKRTSMDMILFGLLKGEFAPWKSVQRGMLPPPSHTHYVSLGGVQGRSRKPSSRRFTSGHSGAMMLNMTVSRT